MEQQSSQKDLEVTGVSRSGRVRKKSSKLMDFQSPDDIEPKSKKAATQKAATKLQQTSSTNTGLSLGQIENNDGRKISTSETLPSDEDLSGEEFVAGENDESLESEGGNSDDIEMENIDEIEDIVDPTVKKSIYMSEKSNKKKVLKDGKIVYSKAQRKDKGKTRFTAYMLWTKDVRKVMLTQQPDLDFATISRRLGEMWANVPTSEKFIWRRRAKRLAVKSKTTTKSNNENITPTGMKSTSKFLNKAATNRTKKTSENQSNTIRNDSMKTENVINLQNPLVKTTTIPSVGAYKVTGIEPLDVAAHLRLLGESLSIIGERLKEHEGQITVSGSLSVLLDSLLCSLGPLMCLTTQIPGVTENKKLRDSLHNTLDNIAYVMPGL